MQREGVIWVTGISGFIGQEVARQARSTGWRVYGIDQAAALGLPLGDEVMIDAAGVTRVSLDALHARSGDPAAVLHLAGGSAVAPSYSDPARDFGSTVGSTLQVLDWLRVNGVPARVVLASSAAVFGDRFQSPIGEDAPRAPGSPYGVHKSIMEDIAAEYRRFFGVDARIARLFSVYGAGLRKQLLWDSCCKLRDSSRLQLGGTGAETRDFIHVRDAARALVRLALDDGAPVALNVGSGRARTVSELARLIAGAWTRHAQGSATISFSGETRAGDPAYLVADTALCRSLGLAPAVTLEDGVDDYVKWFMDGALPGDRGTCGA